MKTDVKLACKGVFTHYFPSDGHPMLLEWLQTFKKIAVLNRYNTVRKEIYEDDGYGNNDS